MNKFALTIAGAVIAIAVLIGIALISMTAPKNPDQLSVQSSGSNDMISASQLMRVPVTGIYPGGEATGLNPHMANPLANDPDAVQRGMKDFDAFNCSGCHMSNGGGGMGPALSNNIWIYRSSPANIYLDIAQGRAAGMPAWGAVLPDRTIWELVAYIQSLSNNPPTSFGSTTSANPQMPNTEQVPAELSHSATPWQSMEPMPPDGGRPANK